MTTDSINTTLSAVTGSARAAAPVTAMVERRSVADVTEALMAEFGTRIDVSVISRTVLDCRDDLLCSPSGAAPHLVERIARQRLLIAVSRSEMP